MSTPWRQRLIAVIDTETTGLDPAVDSIVEIGVALARLEDRGATVVQSRSWLVRPRRPIPAEATAVHGITNSDVATARTFLRWLAKQPPRPETTTKETAA